MDFHLSLEIEARPLPHPTRTRKAVAQVVEEAVDGQLEYETRFTAAIEKGRASARRGALLGHDEVVARIGRLFQA